MKKYMIFLSMFIITVIQADPSFELWNKTDKSIWFAVSSKNTNVAELSKKLEELGAGKYLSKTDLDITKYTQLLIMRDRNAGSGTLYTFNPGKNIWVRLKEEKGKATFGPQTGPLMGFRGVTERGYPLDKNVKSGEYKEQVVTIQKSESVQSPVETKTSQKIEQTPTKASEKETDQKAIKAQQDTLLSKVSKENKKKWAKFNAESFKGQTMSAYRQALIADRDAKTPQEREELINWLEAVKLDPKLNGNTQAHKYIDMAIESAEMAEMRKDFAETETD